MQFEIKNINKSINDLMRTIGYMPAYFQNDGEFSIIKKIGRNDYPRFHLYIVQNSQSFIFKLHLDQKKPSYEGSTGHSGALATIHANNPKSAFMRMAQLYKFNNVPGMKEDDIYQILHEVIDIVVQLQKTDTGRKLVGVYYKHA